MNLRRTLLTTIFVALAGAAHAHDCSGGAEGGMDATGNQCSDNATQVAAVPASSAAGPDIRDARAPRTAARAPAKPEHLARARIAQGR